MVNKNQENEELKKLNQYFVPERQLQLGQFQDKLLTINDDNKFSILDFYHNIPFLISRNGSALHNNSIQNFLTDNKAFKLGVFSKLLANTPIFLYNNPVLSQKYPNGFITENRIFIHTSYLEEKNKQEQEIVNNYQGNPNDIKKQTDLFNYSSDAFLHIKNLISLIEYNFDVQFSSEDIHQLFFKNLFRFTPQKFLEPFFDFKIPFVPTADLKTTISSLNLEEETMDLFNSLDDDTSVINSILFKSQEVHQEDHFLNKIADKVIYQEDNVLLNNMSVKKFKEIYNDGISSSGVNNAYDILNKIVHNAIKTSVKNETNVSSQQAQLVTILEKKWIPLLVILNDQHLFYALENLGLMTTQAFENDNKLEAGLMNQYREKLAHLIHEMGDFQPGSHRSSLLIESITDFSSLARNPHYHYPGKRI